MSRVPDTDDPAEGPSGAPGGGKWHASRYGPDVPEQAADPPPFRIDRIAEVGARNHAGEVVIMIDGRNMFGDGFKAILACDPRSGRVMRAAVQLQQQRGYGYISTDPATLPGNLCDVAATIALEAGAADRR